MATLKRRRLEIRLTEKEYAALKRYCIDEQRTQSDVIREMVRLITKASKSKKDGSTQQDVA
ncbi:MAG TPA: ribbon-helix-helix protein, CopG family [Candidatus Caenarcaniphilales bacterium]|jgi:hypothetical protein